MDRRRGHAHKGRREKHPLPPIVKEEFVTANQQDLKRAQTIAQILAKAERPVRVLRSVAWPSSVRQAFFAGRAQVLPSVQYIPYDGQISFDYLQKARALLPKGHDLTDDPVMAWLSRTADRLERANHMLEAIGTADFHAHSKQLYAPPQSVLLDGKTTSLDLAHHMDDTLTGLSHDKLVGQEAEIPLDAASFAAQLSAKLEPYFKAQTPEVQVTSNLSAKALAGSRRIRIHADAKFTEIDVRQLLHHEALVHAATAINGRAQTFFPILGAAHAGTTEIQEGLAVFAEIISGAMDPVRFRRLVDRVIAINMAVEGADFIEVYRYFLGRNPDETQAFEDTRRVFRGGVMTGGAPFTKDGVYLNGLLRVHNFLRTVTKLGRADLIRLLFVGKLDLEDIPAMAVLADQGVLQAPQIVPPWISDMRFLVSYLAYSSFLNQVKLPGFQTYYQTMVAGVPDVWDFGSAQ